MQRSNESMAEHGTINLRTALVFAAALALVYVVYMRFYASPVDAAANEGYEEPSLSTEAGARFKSCLKGNFLDCSKYEKNFNGRTKSAVEKYQDQIDRQRAEQAQPLLPGIQPPPVQDYMMPVMTSTGSNDKITSLQAYIPPVNDGAPSTVSSTAAVAMMERRMA